MLAILFNKNTRFSDLRKQLAKIKKKKNALLIATLMLSSVAFAQEHQQHNNVRWPRGRGEPQRGLGPWGIGGTTEGLAHGKGHGPRPVGIGNS